MVKRTMLFLLCLSLLSPACATRHAKIESPCTHAGCSELLALRLEYTAKGLPVFLGTLSERPARDGDRFILVQLSNGKPTRSYAIVAAKEGGDFTKPFKAVYDWTGRGFVGGARLIPHSFDAASHMGPGSGEEAGVVLAIAFAPVVIGTAGGFVIGVADGIRTTAGEVTKVVAGKQEQVIAYTNYEYDALGRLVLMRMFDAGGTPQELVRTEYTYQSDQAEPQKATITTFPDGNVRVVE